MGRLCFLILIDDAVTNTPHRWKYVDDCTVGVSLNNKNPDYSALQTTLNSLQEWSAESRMTINHTKTVVMHILTSSAAVPHLPTTIPGSSPPPSSSVSQAARSHNGRSADMEITRYCHSEIGSLQTLHAV
ncbi:hypothetical protein E2C01_090077 [Portunus trituberculatus]|uniref:Reverse transcriptase domain-containing protein n=1 Tax=Portunus trituberculatus TaxID=210409 RepID=A0A5B7JP48_PORTR|nr:hypothetical protein [Portunus trituberculatus]